MVPVTTYRPVTTLQPVVTYYYPPQVDCSPCPPLPAAAPVLPAVPATPAPQVDEFRQNPPSVMPNPMETIPPPNVPTTVEGAYPRLQPPRPNNGGRGNVNVASLARNATLRGEVVLNDRQTPRANSRVIFMNAERMDLRIPAMTNAFGEFDVTLPAGDWYVYLSTGDGRAVYHKKITVHEYDNPMYRVVSR
jgi:hypothetical protein